MIQEPARGHVVHMAFRHHSDPHKFWIECWSKYGVPIFDGATFDDNEVTCPYCIIGLARHIEQALAETRPAVNSFFQSQAVFRRKL